MYLCDQAHDWLTLTFLPGLGCVTIRRLVELLGSPAAVLSAGQNLRTFEGVSAAQAAAVTNGKSLDLARKKADAELDRLHAANISLLNLDSAAYPSLLKEIYDPPVLLFVRGELQALSGPMVAVIGSRAATTYGKRISQQLAKGLADVGVTVVSGAAYGIDAAAHQGALSSSGTTLAVFGCGVDVAYPKAHTELFHTIMNHGAVLSEYPCGTRPDGFRFPERNRIISGLAAGVIVVEATEKSGSLITARLALDQGRDVFAVPGRVDSMKSRGSHRLIQQGAHLVQSVEDVVAELGFACLHPSVPGGEATQQSVHLNESEQKILAVMDVYPVDIETLSLRSGIDMAGLHPILLNLELEGALRQLPGQLYERVDPT